MAQQTPVSIVPAVVGYYHIPPVWVGTTPTDEEFRTAPAEHLTRDEYQSALACGVHVRVRRDGLFLFDCKNWSPGGEIEIPAHDSGPGIRTPQAVMDPDKQAETKAAMRVRLMNVHQACVSTAHSVVKGRACELGAPIRSRTTLRFLQLSDNQVGGLSLHDPFQAYIARRLSFAPEYRAPSLRSRLFIEREVLAYSFQLLDNYVNESNYDLLQLVDLLYHAANRFSEHRYAESLVLSWSVCEALLNRQWKEYVGRSSVIDEDKQSLNKERRKKLFGRDFTASVISEILELSGVLPRSVFDGVEQVRKNRNAWLHAMEVVSSKDAASAVRSAETLFEHVTRLKISLALFSIGGYAPVPKHLIPGES